MILAFAFHAATLGFGQAPAPAVLPQALAEQDVRVVLQTSPTHFAAENLGTSVQLLLVGDLRFGATTSMTLAPGQRVEHVISSAARSGLWIEVLERNAKSWNASGALSLTSIDGMAGEQAGELWIERREAELIIWTSNRYEGLEEQLATGHLSDQALRNSSKAGTLHVPGAPPSDKGGDTPPKVPEKTLPPF